MIRLVMEHELLRVGWREDNKENAPFSSCHLQWFKRMKCSLEDPIDTFLLKYTRFHLPGVSPHPLQLAFPTL